ncbi:MAG: hypothetical protein ACREJ2_05365 [Planctomycetota bacterium]
MTADPSADAPRPNHPPQPGAAPTPAASATSAPAPLPGSAPSVPSTPSTGTTGATGTSAKPFVVLGSREASRNAASATPLWLWALALSVVILCVVKIYLHYTATADAGSTLSHLSDRVQTGSDSSRARAMIEMASGDFPPAQQKLLLTYFDDSQPVALSDLAVVLLATHYRLRAIPTSPADIQVIGEGSPTTIEYPGGRPSYLTPREKYDLKMQIERRIAAAAGHPLPAEQAAPEPASLQRKASIGLHEEHTPPPWASPAHPGPPNGATRSNSAIGANGANGSSGPGELSRPAPPTNAPADHGAP